VSVIWYKRPLGRTRYEKVVLGRLAVVATRGLSGFERHFVRSCPSEETGRLGRAEFSTRTDIEKSVHTC